MDEVEVKLDIQSTNASADEPRPAKRQVFELAKSPENPASKSTALSSPKKPKAASSTSSSSPRAQPPACQVEKCAADLADAKEYYRRHRVCEQHSKARIVLVLGLQQRFCQQCSRPLFNDSWGSFIILVSFEENCCKSVFVEGPFSIRCIFNGISQRIKTPTRTRTTMSRLVEVLINMFFMATGNGPCGLGMTLV